MIKRALWLGVGIAVGVVIARKVTSVVQAYSPGGLAGSARNSAAGAFGSVRDFIADVRTGMAEREEQIHEAFARGVGLDELDNEDDDLGPATTQNGNGAREQV
jgi:hypothetical protein